MKQMHKLNRYHTIIIYFYKYEIMIMANFMVFVYLCL